MQRIFVVHNLIDPDDRQGRTYKEINLEKQHVIPLGTLVEVKWDDWFGEGCCWKVHARLWVIAHRRDCDGTPLYSLSRWSDPAFATAHDAYHGFAEEELIPVEITDALKDGEGALEWKDAS